MPGSVASASSAAAAVAITVITCFIDHTEKFCQLCGKGSKSSNPFGVEDDESYGCLPWCKNVATKFSNGIKIPSGKFCRVCMRVYQILGLDFGTR